MAAYHCHQSYQSGCTGHCDPELAAPRGFLGDAEVGWASLLPDSVSRFSRLSSARNSATDWQRMSRSFSNVLLMMRSSSEGISLFRRTGATGTLCRMLSKMAPDVLPLKGSVPVAISYSTTPTENRSVRASNSLPSTCSGDI